MLITKMHDSFMTFCSSATLVMQLLLICTVLTNAVLKSLQPLAALFPANQPQLTFSFCGSGNHTWMEEAGCVSKSRFVCTVIGF